MSKLELAEVRAFPQLEMRKLPTNFVRALCARTINNETAFKWVNRDFVRGMQQVEIPALSPVSTRVAADLKENGVAFANFSEFFEPSFLETIRAAFDRFRDEFNAAQKGGKLKGKAAFLDTIHKAHTFALNDPVSDFLADPQFAAISANYMDMVPRYVGSSFWHTKPAPADRMASQLWHRDYNDRRLVKVFLYLNDVGRENGFFEPLTGTHFYGPYGQLFDNIGSNGFRDYPDQEAVEKMISGFPVVHLDTVAQDKWTGTAAPWHNKPSVIKCEAPAGTLIFCDTYGIHRGGFVQTSHRDMIMLTYSTNFNVHKPHFSVTKEYAERMSPFMKMAFGVA